MLLVDDLYHLLNHFGIFCGNVSIFVHINSEVVQLCRTILHYQLPVAHTQRHHIGLVEFPVEEFMLFLFSIIATKGFVER